MRQAVGHAGLLERDSELAAVEDALEQACEGEGGVLAVEAAAGLGKTALLAEAQDRARAHGMQVIAARGFELERSFTFGILRQLYEPLLNDAGDDERARLLDGAAALAGPAVGAAELPGGESIDPMFAVAHGVYWLTANLTADRPLLIVIDDAQWSDTASLRCAIYLAGRLTDLRALLLTAVRPGEPDAPEELLAGLVADPRTHLLQPSPLSVEATRTMIGDRVGGDVDEAFASAAHELTGGNPFFVGALASDLRDRGMDGGHDRVPDLPALTSEAVGRAVLVRLIRLGEDAVALAQATAVLGDGAQLPVAARLAGLELYAAAAAADRLTGADVLRPAEHLAFTHPLVHAAVRDETPPHVRALLHVNAARLLHETGGSAEQVGSQLLRAPTAGDDWVTERLVEAGEAAQARGDLDSALAFLGRAMDEPPAAGDRAEVLYQLGRAEVRAGVAEGMAHLEQAVELATEPALRAAIEFHRARAMMFAGRPEAVEAITRASADLPDDERGDAVRMQAELIALGRILPYTAPMAAKLTRALEPVAERGDPGWEAALGVLAGQAWMDNRPAAEVIDRARRSLAGRRRRGEDPAESLAFMNAGYALALVGEYEEAEELLEHAIVSARRAGALIGFAASATFRASSALRRGDLAQAESDVTMALEAGGPSLSPLALPGMLGVLVEVLVERGDLDAADRMLEEHGLTDEQPGPWTSNIVVYSRGRLREAQGDMEAALADLTGAGVASLALEVRGPGPFSWRPWAAIVLAALGRTGEAEAMAEEALALARGLDHPREIGLALRAAGIVAGGDAGIALLQESVDALVGSPVEIELARSRTDLGAALRHAGRRQPAREVLRDALDGAARCGATALADRARAELVATGAKPRREHVTGRAALTASERRVAELALEGLTNRQIAEALFVTASTVEKHLASTYSKLGIPGRAGLAEEFAGRPLSG